MSDTSAEKLYKSKDWLVDQYCNKEKAIKQLRREYGYNYNTLKRWLRKFNIEIRQIGNEVVSKQQGRRKDGEPLGYARLHIVMRSRLPKFGVCNKCKKETDKLDCANISGKYKEDTSDWEWLCRSCHVMSDGRYLKMMVGRGLSWSGTKWVKEGV